MRGSRLGLVLAATACAAVPSRAQMPRYVTAATSPGAFAIATAGRVAAIHADSLDYPGVVRAARDLRGDVARVTSVEPAFSLATPATGTPIVVGTVGRSASVDRLVREGKLDVKALAGRWETFVIQVVPRPFPGVERALIIAGSDKRGTIFGIYDLSAQIGVSPWSWWADVPVESRRELFVRAGRWSAGTPAVKYRGIFINDEAPAFSGWTREKFGGVNHKVYTRVFELILRLKGNYLWPAMWGNAFADDDSLNAILAEEYGVVMGTSHHEPMTRAQQEWRRYGSGAWNYEENDSTLRAFWRRGIERMHAGSRENIVTLGMRGDGDLPMTPGSNVALLERIVADQRKILADVTRKPLAETPQLWALYKEVQDYYDRGMRVPDDVTLLFADDNWGNVRRLPAPADRGRPGGFGVYYHFDYVGGPRNYKWLNTNPIAKVWEQMNLSYRLGADRIWIVNVGDIKPMEFPIQFFLDFAWNPQAWPASRLADYTRDWTEQQFGPASATEIADVITTTLNYAGRRKPELLAPETYSLSNYREAETVVGDYTALAARAQRLYSTLAPRYRDAFYQLVLHPVLAAANLNELYVTVAKNRVAAAQGRASANDLAARARVLFDRDAEIARYYNDTLAGGKWSHMMDQTHIGYTYWQEPPRNVMPRVDVIQVPVTGELGVAWEGQVVFGPPGSGFAAPPGFFGPGGAGRREPALPQFDPYHRQTRWIDVYNRGQTPVEFRAESGNAWVTITPSGGTLAKEQRLSVSVDWTKAPVGVHRVPITITAPPPSPASRRFVIQAPVFNPAAPRPDAVVGFVQGDGVVSMEAEHYTTAVASNGTQWLTIPSLGRTRSGVTLVPPTAAPQTPGSGASRLEYQVTLFDSGTVDVKGYFSPSLNFTGSSSGLRYAMSFDDEPPRVVNIAADSSNAVWERAVADAARVMTTRHQIARPGRHVLKFWSVDPGVVLQKIVVDLGGERPSYLGPPESFRSVPPERGVKIAPARR